ncbi:uncharacterized protein LOC108745231 isoform X2 [Agrilus planipennis]|uniref:Uncharacterized protein LOC108745231 isoform X2 n=1 Tax=Agrilus planipennis TaxID=224129 RepID=A0A1W4XLA0_AGRPL|nr:uncharacterized protein LOC108745231 isoform X2 [Agrilus planipennis]
MFILKDIFKIGSSSRSNNASHTENLHARKQGKKGSVLDKDEFILEESKDKRIHGWLSRDSKNKKRNFNDDCVKNKAYVSTENKKSQHQDSKKKQYEDFRHIKRDYFKEGSVNFRKMEFEDLEGFYCNHEGNIDSVENNVQIKFHKAGVRRGKLYENNCIHTRKELLKEKFYDNNEETSETSNEDSSVDEEELTPTPESVEDETETDSDKSFSNFSDYSSTAVIVYPGKISEGKSNSPNKIIHKKKIPQSAHEKKLNDKKHMSESSGYKRKYVVYHAEEENQVHCVCPPKRMRNLKFSSHNIKHKRKYSDSNHRRHNQSTVRTSSTDPFRYTRGNPKIPANRRVVVIKQPTSLTRPKRYVDKDYTKHKRSDYLLIPSGKRKFQRSRFTASGSRTEKNRNPNDQTSSSSDISSENGACVNKYNNCTDNFLKEDVRKRRSKNDFLVEHIKQNKTERQGNRENLSSLRSKHPQNMNDILDETQNHQGNPQRKIEDIILEHQRTIKENNKLPHKVRSTAHTKSPKSVNFAEQSNKKYETFENRNESQDRRVEKRYTKKKRHDRDHKKCLECQQDIFVEKGIGEPNHNKKVTDPNEEKKILQKIIDINKDVRFNEEVTNFMKMKNTGKEATTAKGLKELDRGEFQEKKEQSASIPTTANKDNYDNNRKLDKSKLITRINRLKKPMTDTIQSSTGPQLIDVAVENGKPGGRARTKCDELNNTNNEISKKKKLKQNNDTLLDNMTSDFTTTEKSSMKKSEKHNSTDTRRKEPLSYSTNVAATYVLLNTKGSTKNRSFNKQDESSWELSDTKRDRNLQLFKLLEEMLGRRKAKRSKSKNIHTVSAVSLTVTKKERTIYKDLHKNILKRYRASTSTSGMTFSKTNKPISKNSGTKKNKTRIDVSTNNNKRRKKITKPKLEISTLPGIEISPSTMRVMQYEINEKNTALDNNCHLKIDDTENQKSTTENEQKQIIRKRPAGKFRTSRKIGNNNQKSESAGDFSLEIKESHTGSSSVQILPKSQSCTDTQVNDEEKPSSTGNISKEKKLSANSSLLVLNLSDSKDDIESKEWISNKLKSSKSSGENMMKTGQTVNEYKTFQRKLFSTTAATNRNPLLYPSTFKIEVKDIFRPATVIQSDVTESKAAAPTTPSGDTLLLTFTDSEIWGNNFKEEKNLTEEEQREERSDSTEMIEKLENSLQKSIVQDLKNCSRHSERSLCSSPDSTLNTSETQRCIEEWENLVKRKVLQQLRRKVSTYCKHESSTTVSPILNQYSIYAENFVDNEKIQDKNEITDADYDAKRNIPADVIGKRSELENKNQKSKKRSNLSMSPLETVFEAEEQPTEVIEVELLKESSSFTQMRIFKNVENDADECDSNLKDFEDKISKLRNLNDLENMEDEINNFLGNCSLNLQISIDDNEEPLDVNSKNKASNEGDDLSEKLMNIYSFNMSKNNNKGQAEETVKNPTTIQCESITSTEVLAEPKPLKEENANENCKLEKVEISECQSNSGVPEDTGKYTENRTKTKGNKKIFSRLPVYVKKVKDFKGSLFSNPHQIQKSPEPSKVTSIHPISKEVENKNVEKSTQDEGTTCNLVLAKKVDNTINTEVQEKKDQTTNYGTKIINKQNKSVSCDFQENTKRHHGLLPNKSKVKNVISNCLKKYRLTNFNKEPNVAENKSEKQNKTSICSDSSQFTTSTESLYFGENSDIDTYHSKTEKECQTTCIQSFTTNATYTDKNQKRNPFPDQSRSSNCSDFTNSSKTIESDLCDLSTTTYSTFYEVHDGGGMLQCEDEDTPNRLISVLDEKIKKLSKQKSITKCDNSTCTAAKEFMMTQELSDDVLSSSGQCDLKTQNRNVIKDDHMPKHYRVTRSSFTKLKPKITYNLTKESSAFCNLRPTLNTRKITSQRCRLRNKVDNNKSQITEEMDSKNLSSFQKRKLYWESLKKSEKKCTFAINTKKSKYFLMLSGKDKKKGSGKRRSTSFFEKVLKPSEPSIFFKPLSKPLNQQKQHNYETKSKNDKTKLNRSMCPKINTINVTQPSHNNPNNYPSQYDNPFIGCSRYVRVRHSSSLISIANKAQKDQQKRPSSSESKIDICNERLPTFYSYNFCNEESNNNKKFNCHSNDSIVENTDRQLPFVQQHVEDFKLMERKSSPFMDTGSHTKNRLHLHSHDYDFVQNYDISEICNGNMDHTLEKQFVNKVKKRAKELFKNFMDELNADSIAVNKVEKGSYCVCEDKRQEAVDLESLAEEIYDDYEDPSTERSFSQKTKDEESNTDKESETTGGTYCNSKSKISTFTISHMEQIGKKHKEEPYEIISANTSGDTNVTSFDEYENACTEFCCESVRRLNGKFDKFSRKPITLARAEITTYPNYISQSANVDFVQRFNNDGDIIKESQSNENLYLDNKISKKQVSVSKDNDCPGQTLESSNEKKFDVESFNGDLYNSESEINFIPSVDETIERSSKSINSKKILSTIDSISCVDNQNSFENKKNTMYNLKTVTEKTIAQKFGDTPSIMENARDYDNGKGKPNGSTLSVTPSPNPLNLFKSINQSSRLKHCKSYDSFNGEVFRPPGGSYFSSDSETVKQHVIDVSENCSSNCSESFDESNENGSETSSTSQTNGPYLIIQDCIISDEDKFLQDFTETSSFASDNFLTRKQNESDLKSDFSNSSTTFSHHTVLYDNNASIDAESNSSGTIVDRETIEINDNNVTNSTRHIANNPRYCNLLNSFEFETNNLNGEDKDDNAEVKLDHSSKTYFTIKSRKNRNIKQLPSSENHDYFPNSRSGDTMNATKIYESPADPHFSSIRIYHENIVADTNKERLLQGECSTVYGNQNNENSTTSLNINKENNCSDETVLDEFPMTLASYESNPNLCSSQNQNQGFGINTNSGTSKLTPEEMDSGFESTKHKTNAQRLLIKTVSTSDLQDLNASVNSIQESRSSHSMFESVSSFSLTKNFFHNVRRKSSRKKNDSLTALSRAVQLQRRSSVYLNPSYHWKEFWKNVQQVKDNPSKQTMNDDISKGDVGKCEETLTEEKHLFFDSLKHLKDFHFENTYLSYSLFGLDNYPMNKGSNTKCFPVGNRNFLTYNVFVYNGKERCDKATQTRQDVFFIPYVSVIALPANPTKLSLAQQKKFSPGTSKNNSELAGCFSRYENRRPVHTSLNKTPEINETTHSDLEEIRHEKRPCKKKRTKKTEENADLYDTLSLDDSGCGTFSSEKSYKIPKRLSIETFQGYETSPRVNLKDNLASIQERRSSFQYTVTNPVKTASNMSFADENYNEPTLDTNKSPRSNIEEQLSTTNDEYEPCKAACTYRRIQNSKSRNVNEPISSSTTVNRHNVGKRKLRKRSNKNQEKNDLTRDVYSSDDNEENLKSNDYEDQKPRCSLSTQRNVRQQDNIRLQRPLLNFVKNNDSASKLRQNDKNNDKFVEPKGAINRTRNISDISRIQQPKINIVAKDNKQQITNTLNEGKPTVLQNNVNIDKEPLLDEIAEGHHEESHLKEINKKAPGIDKANNEIVKGGVEIEDELGHDIQNINKEPLSNEIGESHLHQQSNLKVINAKPPGIDKANNEIVKGGVEIEDELGRDIQNINKEPLSNEIGESHLYQQSNLKVINKEPRGTHRANTEIVKGGVEIEDELGRDIQNINNEPLSNEIGESHLHQQSNLKVINEEPPGTHKANTEIAKGGVEIEDKLGHDIQNINKGPLSNEIGESHLYQQSNLKVINEEPPRSKKTATLTKISDTKEAILQNEVQPCSCMKKMMEIINPQTSDEIKKIHKFYEIVGCSCGSKKVVKELPERKIKAEDEFSHENQNTNTDTVLEEVAEGHLNAQPKSEVIVDEPAKLGRRATLARVFDTDEQTTQVINYDETLDKNSKKKEASHCLISETELLKQQNNKEHQLRSSLTDKEIFEKLLASYEKEDKLIRELSREDDFLQFESTLEDRHQSATKFEEPKHNHVEKEESKSKIFDETKKKNRIREKPLERSKKANYNRSSTDDIDRKESGSLKMEEFQIIESNANRRRARFFGKKKTEAKKQLSDRRSSNFLTDDRSEKEKEVTKGKKSKITDGISFSSNEDSLKVKKGDIKPITEEDIIKSKELVLAQKKKKPD